MQAHGMDMVYPHLSTCVCVRAPCQAMFASSDSGQGVHWIELASSEKSHPK